MVALARRQVRGNAQQQRAWQAWLRVVGVSALFASLTVCFAVDHASTAVLIWVMMLAVAAPIIAFTLPGSRDGWRSGPVGTSGCPA